MTKKYKCTVFSVVIVYHIEFLLRFRLRYKELLYDND